MKNLLSQSAKIAIFAVLFFVLLNRDLYAEKVVFSHQNVYTFYYQSQDSLLLKMLLEKTADDIQKIEHFFEIRPQRGIHIFLTKSSSEFQSYARDSFPEWAQAIAKVNERVIIIRIANSDDVNRLPQVFVHELVHIFLGIRNSQVRIPTWMHEGIAQWLSNEALTVDEQILIANTLVANRLPGLQAMDSLFVFSQNKVKVGYALSRSAIDFFLQHYSSSQLLAIIDQLNNRVSINKAFKKETGRDFIDFEIAWFAFLDDQYKWMVLLNVPEFVWILLLLVFLAALIRIHFKNKKTIRSWQDENETDFDEVR